MEKENSNENIVSNNERISHRNILWLIYRALSEDIQVDAFSNEKNILKYTEENR